MSMIERHIKNIIRIAKIADNTDKSLDELHGLGRDLGVNPFDEKWRERFKETNIADKALHDYLAQLNDDDLSRIQAIMYSGRDNESASVLKESFSKSGHATRDNMLRSITEKRGSLDVFLKKGLESTRHDLNIDEL